jgi:hypothetical protein
VIFFILVFCANNNIKKIKKKRKKKKRKRSKCNNRFQPIALICDWLVFTFMAEVESPVGGVADPLGKYRARRPRGYCEPLEELSYLLKSSNIFLSLKKKKY